MEIVARKCLHHSRKRSKRRESHLERDEPLRAVLAQVEKLPDEERQLLVLYYGAELAQSEIGHVLSIPQWKVSRKLQGALERLQSGLAAAGVVAAEPLLSADGMRQVLCEGHPVPSGMFERIMDRVAKAAQAGKPFSRRESLCDRFCAG